MTAFAGVVRRMKFLLCDRLCDVAFPFFCFQISVVVFSRAFGDGASFYFLTKCVCLFGTFVCVCVNTLPAVMMLISVAQLEPQAAVFPERCLVYHCVAFAMSVSSFIPVVLLLWRDISSSPRSSLKHIKEHASSMRKSTRGK